MCPKLTELLSWNGPTVHVWCFMLARASTKTFVSRVQKNSEKIFVRRKILQQGHSLAEVSLYTAGWKNRGWNSASSKRFFFFISKAVHTGPGFHSACLSLGIRVMFGGVKFIVHFHLIPSLRMSRVIPRLPPLCVLMAPTGTASSISRYSTVLSVSVEHQIAG